jgi:hypothetical protein
MYVLRINNLILSSSWLHKVYFFLLSVFLNYLHSPFPTIIPDSRKYIVFKFLK